MKLKRKSVAKPWGKEALPELFGGKRSRKIGEIWFEAPEGVTPSLLTKYLFTSEKLSVQVHPNDRLARRQGLPSGKSECWYVLDAEPDAVLGLGLTKETSTTKMRTAAILGEIEALIDWKPVKAGDFFYVPAGTVHAIGSGINLLEIQQNVDVTYRLYDYGRPRELHLDDALNAAQLKPYDNSNHVEFAPDESTMILDGPQFRVFQLLGDDRSLLTSIEASEWQVMPLSGTTKVRGKTIAAGECGICGNIADIDLSQNEKSIIACNMK